MRFPRTDKVRLTDWLAGWLCVVFYLSIFCSSNSSYKLARSAVVYEYGRRTYEYGKCNYNRMFLKHSRCHAKSGKIGAYVYYIIYVQQAYEVLSTSNAGFLGRFTEV